MHITFVKKILADGQPCGKCRDVAQRLSETGQMARIDEVIVADERNPASPGMQLAAEHNVERAPFFVVRDGASVQVYTVYLKFVREVLGNAAGNAEQDENREILRNHPELDLL